MATPLSGIGNQYVSPDLTPGTGVLISDIATRLTAMRNAGTYFEELNTGSFEGSEILLVQCENMMLTVYRSFVLQRLMSQFVFRVSTINGAVKLRCVSRNLAISMTLEQALRSVGQSTTGLTDTYDAAGVQAQNAILAGVYMQIFLT